MISKDAARLAGSRLAWRSVAKTSNISGRLNAGAIRATRCCVRVGAESQGIVRMLIMARMKGVTPTGFGTVGRRNCLLTPTKCKIVCLGRVGASRWMSGSEPGLIWAGRESVWANEHASRCVRDWDQSLPDAIAADSGGGGKW